MPTMPSAGILFTALLALASHSAAHSNVERLMRIAPNGTMVGKEGFPRGFVSRTNPAYSDPAVGWLLPPNGRPDGKVIHPDDKVASPPQRVANYTNELPMLVASPGDLIALQYQENGHVTLPDNQPNKALNRGTIYIYGTTELAPDANLLDILYQWTPDGTGGDGKGSLLATRNFDDGQCYQLNGGPISQTRVATFAKSAENPMGQNLWCQSDVALPNGLAVGKPYTLIWIWDWPTLDRPDVAAPPSSAPGAAAGTNGAKVEIPEIYTTVMDVQIVDPCDESLGQVKGPGCKVANTSVKTVFAKGQDLNLAAIAEQIINSFLVDVPGITGGSGSPNASATTNSSPPATTRCSGHHPHGPAGGRVKTKTVYSNIKTVTVTTTVGVAGPTAVGTGASSLTSEYTPPTGAPTVSSFMKIDKLRRVRT